MNTQEFIQALEQVNTLMLLHGADEFKARAYASAAQVLDKLPDNALDDDELLQQSLSKGMFQKAQIFKVEGIIPELVELQTATPQGVIDLLQIAGLGPKKVRSLWLENEIDTVEKLSAKIDNNELANLKGFGAKTQETLKGAVETFLTRNKWINIANAWMLWEEVIEPLFKEIFKGYRMEVSGSMARYDTAVESISILLIGEYKNLLSFSELLSVDFEVDKLKSSPFALVIQHRKSGYSIEIRQTEESTAVSTHLLWHSAEEHLNKIGEGRKSLYQSIIEKPLEKEEEIYYEAIGLPFIQVKMRNGYNEWDWAKQYSNNEIIEEKHIKGFIHNHSTYSDGKNSLEEMALAAANAGMEYFGIADHSRSAGFYANGLEAERVAQQHIEIEALNNKLQGTITILKGIESDILKDGELDYDTSVLKSFDYIVASIHNNLNMDIVKATDRLIAAINNPYTDIIGHPTGRLLLRRAGYPIDVEAVLNACAENKVAIELNAHYWRLDLDWRFLKSAMDKGVMISINPDAHSTEGFKVMRWGIAIAQKGGLQKAFTLNALSKVELMNWLKQRRNK